MLVALLLAAGFALLLLSPTLSYLWGVWRRRREEILTAFSPGCIRRYRDTFFPTLSRDGSESEWMAGRYDSEFGRVRYLYPCLFLFALGGLSVFLAVRALQAWDAAGDFEAAVLPPIGLAALTGAYVWVFLDHAARWRRSDLLPVDVSTACIRFVIAIPLGYALAPFANEDFAFAIAFLVGAFPTRTITTLSKRLVWQQLSMDPATADAESELVQLQGVRRRVAERLADEGVHSIAQLAYQDPVDLCVRTSYPFSFVVDLVSQALAWIYLQESLADLRLLGFRGGQEVYVLILELEGDDKDDARAARETIGAAAEVLEIDPKVFERTLKEIAGDPHTQFLVDIWHPVAGSAKLSLRIDAVREVATVINEGEQEVDLRGWSVGRKDSSTLWFVFAESRVLAPGAAIEIRSGPDAEQSGGSVVWTHRHVWRDEGGQAQLADPDDYVIAEADW